MIRIWLSFDFVASNATISLIKKKKILNWINILVVAPLYVFSVKNPTILRLKNNTVNK